MDYVRGFGDLTGEFWVGLSKIHQLIDGENELRVDLEDFEGNAVYAKYASFAIGGSMANYRLTVSGYSGTAGDSLLNHNGYQFSTKDKDNDVSSSTHCAYSFAGAWWYSACHASNLNGLYLVGVHSSYADGVEWSQWKGYYYSLKFTEMKVRRRQK